MPKKSGVRHRHSESTLPPDWGSRRAETMIDAGHTCEHQGPRCTKVATEVHHKIPRRKPYNGGHGRENRMAVCHECHLELGKMPVVPFPWA